MSTFYGNYPISGSAAGGNPSVGANTTPAPAFSTEIGYIDGSGNLQGVSTTNPLPVNVTIESVTTSENLAQVNGATVNVGTGTSGAGTQRVAVASDSFPATQAVTQSTSPWVVSGTVSTHYPVNTNGSASNSTTVGSSSATSFSPPANAIGFVIEAESSNTVNLRYAIGTTATTTVGLLLEPGRDSGFMPAAATVTVIALTGSGQSVGIQWIMSS